MDHSASAHIPPGMGVSLPTSFVCSMSVLIRRVFITLYGAWSSHSFARTQGASQASAQGRLQGLPAVLWPPGLLLNHQYLGNQVPKPIQDFLVPHASWLREKFSQSLCLLIQSFLTTCAFFGPGPMLGLESTKSTGT